MAIVICKISAVILKKTNIFFCNYFKSPNNVLTENGNYIMARNGAVLFDLNCLAHQHNLYHVFIFRRFKHYPHCDQRRRASDKRGVTYFTSTIRSCRPNQCPFSETRDRCAGCVRYVYYTRTDDCAITLKIKHIYRARGRKSNNKKMGGEKVKLDIISIKARRARACNRHN